MRYLKNSLAFLLIVIWGLLCFANDASAVNPKKQVNKFIKAAKEKDFKTIFDMSFYYQKSLSEIRSNYPKVLADKKSLEYYESKKNEALKEPDKIPLSWELLRLYRHSLLDSVQGLRYLLDHQCKYKILETKRKTAQDRDEYYDYVQFIVYVSFSSPSAEESPKFTLNRKSRPIKEIILEFKTRGDYGGTVEEINIVKDSWVWGEYEDELKYALKDAQRQEEIAYQKEKELREMEGEIKRLGIILKDLERIVPQRKEIPTILRKIQQLAGDSQLNIKKFAPQRETSKEFFSEQPILIEMTGNYQNLGIFFDRLSKFPKLINVDDISVRTLGTQNKDSTVSISFVVKTFVFNGGGREMSKKPAGKYNEFDWRSEKLEQLKKTKELYEKKIDLIKKLKVKQEAIPRRFRNAISK